MVFKRKKPAPPKTIKLYKREKITWEQAQALLPPRVYEPGPHEKAWADQLDSD
jgi:hypothetical protein